MRFGNRMVGLYLAICAFTGCSSPGSQPPTDEEMLSALKYALSGGDSSSTEIGNSVAGVTVEIKDFENLGCEKAEGVPGYRCDYLIDASISLHSNDGSSAGQQQANAMNMLMQSLFNAQKTGPRPERARFAYVKGRDRWMKMND